MTVTKEEVIKKPVNLIDTKTGIIHFCVLIHIRKLHGDRWIEIPAILDQDTNEYMYVDVTTEKLIQRLNQRGLILEMIPEHQYRTCDHCHKFMQKGYVFEGDGTYYCEDCRENLIPDEEYNQLYEDGLAYWTEWYSC